MLCLCMQGFNLLSVTHKYLEKGHTQNEGDFIHASIEHASRNSYVYTTSQWAATVRSARQRQHYYVTEISLMDFDQFKIFALKIKNIQMNTKNNKHPS